MTTTPGTPDRDELPAEVPDADWRPGLTVTRPTSPPTAADREAVRVLHELARAKVEGDWRGGLQPNGVVLMPWVDYDERIHAGLAAVQRMVGVDYRYRPLRSEPGVDVRIETATADELATAFTWVVRGERFSTGHLDGLIRGGRLEALLDRLEEVLGEWEG